MSENGVYQVLEPSGKLRKGAKPALDDEFVLEGLRWMLVSRAFDLKATAERTAAR